MAGNLACMPMAMGTDSIAADTTLKMDQGSEKYGQQTGQAAHADHKILCV